MAEVFSKKIKKIRKLKGLTQQDVAQILRTSRSCIGNYESGTREPDLKTVCRLAELYGVGVEELVNGTSVRSMMRHFRQKEMPQQPEEMSYKQETLDLNLLSAKSRAIILDIYRYLYHEECELSDGSAAEK